MNLIRNQLHPSGFALLVFAPHLGVESPILTHGIYNLNTSHLRLSLVTSPISKLNKAFKTLTFVIREQSSTDPRKIESSIFIQCLDTNLPLMNNL